MKVLLLVATAAYWLRLLIVATAAFFLWRSAFSPRGDDPRGLLDRAVRLCGALLLCFGGFDLLTMR
jgi:hypothetical protein